MSDVENFDLIVIGGGPAGYVASIRAAQLGFKTACVEKRKALGGTCLNVGCIPSKALLDSSEHFVHAKSKLSKHGVMCSDVSLDLAQMMKRKEAVVRQLTNGIAGLFKKNKIELVTGQGKLMASGDGALRQVEVITEKGGRILAAPRVLLATGSEPAFLSVLPFDQKKILSSTEALSLEEVPKHLVVIGAGVIGLELGSVWLRLGSKVTVIEFQDRILPGMDKQLVGELQKILSRQGMEFHLSSKCLGKCLGQGSSDKWLTIEAENMVSGDRARFECDYVLVATGRRPYTGGLGLEALGIEIDGSGRVVVDSSYQTVRAGVYAVGDLIAGPMLAHKAEEEGIAAVEIMANQAGHVNYAAIPGVVYTWPELASVGLTEEEAKEKNIEYRTGVFPFMANGRAKAMDEADGMAKVIADAATDRVLGVHILGARASDMIAEAVAAIEFGGSAEDIARTCHAHPSLSEVLKEAALAVDKRQIHM